MATPRTLGSMLLLLAACGCEGRIEGGGGGSGPPGAPGAGNLGGTPGPHGSVETPNGTVVSCDKPSVGVTPLTRLTREEYVNTLQDVTGLELELGELLPEDERLGGFARNSGAPVSVNELGGYRDAAEQVAKRVAAERKELWACPAGQQGEACATQVIARLGERLHRAALSDAEQARYLTVFKAQGAAGFDASMSAVLEAMLQSPFLLYRLELPPAVVTPGPRSLSGYEVASRLASLLWNSAPDQALLEKAKSGQLESVQQLGAEAQRLLADPRAERAIRSFHRQWLGIADLAQRPKDATLFPGFADSAERLQADAESFAVTTLLEGDGTLASLLEAPFTASDGSARVGVLTQPAFLAAHASADQTSIVLRGNFVRSSLLCDPPPPPPPNADVQAPELDPNSTLRERFAAHEADPTCGACHRLMDPIGFGLESYDAIGRFRETEAGRPVDTAGEITQSKDADGKFTGPVELAERLAASEQVRDCVARQWFDYGFGRVAGDADACAFQGAYDAYRASGYDVRQLLLAFVSSDAFRLKAEAAP